MSTWRKGGGSGKPTFVLVKDECCHMCAQVVIRPSKPQRHALSREMRYSPKFGRNCARYTRCDEVLIGSRKGLLHAFHGGRSVVLIAHQTWANGGVSSYTSLSAVRGSLRGSGSAAWGAATLVAAIVLNTPRHVGCARRVGGGYWRCRACTLRFSCQSGKYWPRNLAFLGER